MAVGSIPMLTWRPDKGLDRFVAEIDGDDDYLVIDYDHDRLGDSKWYLTWYHSEEHPSGLTLQSDVDPEPLKDYARTWVGDDE